MAAALCQLDIDVSRPVGHSVAGLPSYQSRRGPCVLAREREDERLQPGPVGGHCWKWVLVKT
jgi:hypothetical protein